MQLAIATDKIKLILKEHNLKVQKITYLKPQVYLFTGCIIIIAIVATNVATQIHEAM